MVRWEYAQLLIPPTQEDLEAEGVDLAKMQGSPRILGGDPLKMRVWFTHQEPETFSGVTPLEVLRQLGNDGWELVTRETVAHGLVAVFWFKRPLDD